MQEKKNNIKDNGVVNSDKSDQKIPKKITNNQYLDELKLLHIELVKMQDWVAHTKSRVIVIFEGRDAAGKGGVIKRITEPLNPRICRIAALGTPSEREKTEWYFKRYVAHLPAGGEIVLFDRSWYNRGGVEKVLGFCSDQEYLQFMKDCPEFENLLIRSGIILIKYLFSVNDAVQESRFQERAQDPIKRWKLSPMDIKARDLWVEYSKAKDYMFEMTSTKTSPWYVVNADNKKSARLNCIHHLLNQIPYEEIKTHPFTLPERRTQPSNYVRPSMDTQNFVPNIY
jgi:polyphosphate kinase 2